MRIGKHIPRPPSFVIRTDADKELLERMTGMKLVPAEPPYLVNQEQVSVEPMKRHGGEIFSLPFRYGKDGTND